MKQLFAYLFILMSLVCKAQEISKVNVFHLQRGSFRYIRIEEGNIRAAATTKFTITDIDCLRRIDSLIQDGEELKQNLKVSSIFMLCEIIYAHGERKILLFEDRINGVLKLGSKVFKNIIGLDGIIIFCKPEEVSLLDGSKTRCFKN